MVSVMKIIKQEIQFEESLKYISKEDYEKIPNSKIELFETNDIKWYKKVWRFLTKFFRK